MQKYIVFGETRFPVPAGITTIEQARGFATNLIPDLGDALGQVDVSGNFVFTRKAGSKGL